MSDIIDIWQVSNQQNATLEIFGNLDWILEKYTILPRRFVERLVRKRKFSFVSIYLTEMEARKWKIWKGNYLPRFSVKLYDIIIFFKTNGCIMTFQSDINNRIAFKISKNADIVLLRNAWSIYIYIFFFN